MAGGSLARSANNFDALRLLLASLVIAGHSVYIVDVVNNVSSAWSESARHLSDMAVNCFFALSGYLIVQSWQKDPVFPAFLKRRILRIYPGFLAASLISALLVGPLMADVGRYFRLFEWGPFLSGMLMLQVPGLPAVFEGGFVPKNSALWTISYEFRCYLLVGLMGIFGLVGRRLWLGIFLVLLAVLVAFPSLAAVDFMDREQPIIGQPASLLRLLCFFFVGGLFKMYRAWISFRPLWIVAAVVLLALGTSGLGGEHFSARTLVAATAGVYLLFAAAFWPTPLLAGLRGRPDLSYGTYVYGMPVQILLVFLFPAISVGVMFMLALPMALFCGYVSWHLVEKPFLRLKPRSVSGDREVEAP